MLSVNNVAMTTTSKVLSVRGIWSGVRQLCFRVSCPDKGIEIRVAYIPVSYIHAHPKYVHSCMISIFILKLPSPHLFY